jgi:hypothetical protein
LRETCEKTRPKAANPLSGCRFERKKRQIYWGQALRAQRDRESNVYEWKLILIQIEIDWMRVCWCAQSSYMARL